MCYGNGIVDIMIEDLNMSTISTLWLFMRSHNIDFNRINLLFVKSAFTIKYGDFEIRFDPGEHSELWQLAKKLGIMEDDEDNIKSLVEYVEMASRDKCVLECLTKHSSPTLSEYFNGIMLSKFDPIEQLRGAFDLFDEFTKTGKFSFEGLPELTQKPELFKGLSINNMSGGDITN